MIGLAAAARVRLVVPPPADLVSDFFESRTVFFGVLTGVPAAGDKEVDKPLVDSAADFFRAASLAILRASCLLARSAFNFSCSSLSRFILLLNASIRCSCAFLSSRASRALLGGAVALLTCVVSELPSVLLRLFKY